MILARRLSVVSDTVFTMAEYNPTYTPEELDSLLRDYFRRALQDDEEQRQSAKSSRPAYTAFVEGENPVTSDLNVLAWMLDDEEEALANNDLEAAGSRVANLFASVQKAPPEQGTEEYRYLARGVLRAGIEVLKLAMSRRTGDYSLRPSDSLFAMQSDFPASTVGEPSAKATPLLSELTEQYLAHRDKNSHVRKHNIGQAKGTLRDFVDFVKDLPLAEVRHMHVVRFSDALLSLPSKHGHLKDWRTLSFTERLDKAEAEGLPEGQTPVTHKTAQRKVSELSPFFRWAYKRHGVELKNPAEDLDWPRGKAAKDQGTSFEPEELKTLFSQPIWTGCSSRHRRLVAGSVIIKDSRYWLPMVALYSGMRLNEIAQLYLHDVQQQDGIWYFSLTEEEGTGKRLKNLSSKRVIPVHSKLIGLGLLDHVESERKKGSPRVWMDLSPVGLDKTFGDYAGKQFREVRLKAGLNRPLLKFHSFRRSFATALHNAAVSEEVATALLGHGYHSQSYSRYSEGLRNLSLLQESVERISFDIGL